MAEVAKEVKGAISDCKHLAADIHKLEKIVKVFSNPISFIWHVGKDLIVNGVQIYHDVEHALSSYKAKKWHDFGLNVGHATALVILGKETQDAFASGLYFVNEEAEDPEDIIHELTTDIHNVKDEIEPIAEEIKDYFKGGKFQKDKKHFEREVKDFKHDMKQAWKKDVHEAKDFLKGLKEDAHLDIKGNKFHPAFKFDWHASGADFLH